MANPFVHIELATDNPKKAKEFYLGLFDWKLEEMPDAGYTMINVGEGTGGGMMLNPVPDIPSHWLPYILVDDVEATTEKAKSMGATIAKEVTAVENYGWFSVIIDPTGAAFGVWQTNKDM